MPAARVASCGLMTCRAAALRALASGSALESGGFRLGDAAGRAASLSSIGLAMTLSGKAVTTSYSACGRANSSFFLNRIHGSCRSPPFAIFTSSHRPSSFWPCSGTPACRCEPGPRVADRLPGAVVPDDHGASAILLRRDGALEGGIGDRMVLHMDGHPFFLRVEAGALGNSPGQHDAVQFEAESRSAVERRHASGPRTTKRIRAGHAALGRFGSDCEIALCLVERKRVALGP
jgi:hypothetical protein